MVGSAILNSRIVEGHKFYANKNFIEKVRKTIYKQVHYQRSAVGNSGCTSTFYVRLLLLTASKRLSMSRKYLSSSVNIF